MPLFSDTSDELFYIEDSTLYIYDPDVITGIFDDPESDAVSPDPPTLSAVPNPFNSAVSLTWTSPQPQTTLAIYNILGQTVTSLDVEDVDGSLGITWDATDQHGRRVPSGVYFARLQSRKQAVTRKLVLLK